MYNTIAVELRIASGQQTIILIYSNVFILVIYIYINSSVKSKTNSKITGLQTSDLRVGF